MFARNWCVCLLLFFSSAAVSLAQTAAGPRPGATGSVQGVLTFVNDQGQTAALPGASIKLTPATEGAAPLFTVSDEQGHYQFPGLAAGAYQVEASLDGFATQTDTVQVTPGVAEHNFTMRINTVVQTTEVREEAGDVAAENTNTSGTVTSAQVVDLPIVDQNLTSVLPVIPVVMKTRNGVLNIKGASENQGMLLVDSAETVDPVTGSFSIPIPTDVIQTLSVEEAAYNAEYGGFAGGLTQIETKPPAADQWSFALNDFFPGLRGKDDHLRGVSEEKPRLTVTGPVVKGKLNVSQTFTYTFMRAPVRGLTWPLNEIRTRGVGSLTTVQAILTPRHLVTMNVDVFSHRVEFADINALLPQSASSNDGQKGVTAGLTDSYQFVSGMVLNTAVRYTRFDSDAYGQGSASLLITPDGWAGNYFNSWTRGSNQVQLLPTLRLPAKMWLGHHDVKFGLYYTHRAYDGLSQSQPVELFREDGTLAEKISFQGAGRTSSSDDESAAFVQDNWTIKDRVTVQLGGRLTNQSAGRAAGFAPRIGVAFQPTKNGKTTIRAGAGYFYDRVPLLATDFLNNLTRVVSVFGEAGNLLSQPVAYENVYLNQNAGGGFSATTDPLNKYSRNFTWNAEVDRELRRNLQVHASYLVSETQNIPIVMPFTSSSGASYMGLASTGTSHYSEFQTSLSYQAGEQKQFTVTYVHSSAHGDLNSLTDLFVPFEQPVIRPNAVGALPENVPDRLLVSAVVALPFKLTASPLVDLHTGLPYSAVDNFQNYVGAPNTLRYPTFFELDLQVYKQFSLSSLPFMDHFKKQLNGRIFRLGLFSLNLTGQPNPNAVFNDVASPQFRNFAGFAHRLEGFVFEMH